MAKIQIKNSFITSSAQITISSSLVRFSDSIRAKGITGSFSGSFAGSNLFVQGGNSFGTTALLGTNDNQPLVLETNASEKLRIISDGNVGIGTSSPLSKLHILGSNGGTDYVYQRWSYTANVGVYDLILKQTVTSGVVRYNFSMNNASTAYNDVLVLDRGCVGIGTSFPLSKLDVRGTMYVNYGSNGTGYIQTNGTDSDLQITTATNLTSLLNTGTSGAMAFGAGNSERMRILSGGNIGIGTTSPADKLEVDGGVRLRSGNSLTLRNATNDSSAAIYNVGGSNGSIISFAVGPTPTMYVGSNVGIGTTNASAKLTLNGFFGFSGDFTKYIYMPDIYQGTGSIYMQAGYGSALAGGAIRLYGHNATTYTGGDVEVGLSGKGNFLINSYIGGTRLVTVKVDGNVGIGTTSATQKLEVAGYAMAGESSYRTSIYGNSGGAWIGFGDTSNTVSLGRIGAYGSLFNINSLNGATSFQYDGSEKMRITTGGNVGIGTSSPNANLHVSGTFQVGNGTNFGNKFTVYDNLASGKISFALRDTNGDDIFSLYGNSTTGEARLIADDDQGVAFMTFQMNASERMRITNGGNVGIGTTSPASRLQLGNLSSTQTSVPETLSLGGTYSNSAGANVKLRVYEDGGGGAIGGMSVSSGQMEVNTWSAGKIAFYRGTTQSAIIDANGNLGIGTSSPTAKLDVTGDIKVGSGTTSTTKVTGSLHVTGSITLNASRDSNWPFLISDPSTIGGSSRYQLGKVGAMGFNYADSYAQLQIIGASGAYIDLGNSATDDLDARLIYFSNSRLQLEYGTQMAINSTGVGIGTTSPLSLLDVRSGYITAGTGVSTSGTTIIAGYYTSGHLTVLGTEQSSGGPVLGYAVTPSTSATGAFLSSTTIAIPRSAYTQDGGTHRWYTGASQTVAIGSAVSTSEKMRMDTNGNLGIGTSNPVDKLDINGNLYFSKASDPRIYAGTGIGLNIDGQALWLNRNTNASIIMVTGGGNIGIGTNSPNDKLTILADNYLSFQTSNVTFNSGRGARIGATSTGSGIGELIFETYKGGSGGGERMRITSDGCVGIGTTSPSTKLDVRGNLFVANAANGNNIIAFGNIGALGPLNGAPNNLTGSAFLVVSSSTASGAPSHMKFFTTTGGVCGEKMRIAADGNIGINTTAPAYKLDVNGGANLGSISISSTLFADRSGNYTRIFEPAGNPAFYLGNNTDPSNYYDNSTHNFRNRGGSSTYAYINSNGNLGIGTTSPAYKLDVIGVIKASSAHYNTSTDLNALRGNITTMGYSLTNSPSGAGWITVYNSQNSISSGDILSQLAYDNYNQQKLFTRYSSDAGSTWSSWKTIINSDALSGTSNYVPKFTGTNSIGNGTIYDNGNIGIGTTAPATKLDVNGVLSFNGVTVLNQVNDANDIYANIRVIRNRSSTLNDGMYINYDSTGTTAAHLRFYANAQNERMRIQANDGHVGIGTTSAVGRLDVYDSTDAGHVAFVRNASTGTSAYSAIVLRRNGDANGIVLFTNSSNRSTDGGAGNSTIRTDNGNLLLGAGGTTYHILNTAGSVGIGTTSPAYRLDVNGTFRSTGDLWTNGNIVISRAGAYLYINGTNSDSEIVWQANGSNRWAAGMNVGDATENFNVYNYTTATTNFTILKANGNVGIGSTAPNDKLDVVGRVYAYRYIAVSSNASSPAYATDTSTGMYNAATNQIGFSISGTERLRIDSNGNVGIGTASPAQKLHVVGAVYGTTYGQFGTSVASGTNSSYAVFGSNSAVVGVKINIDSNVNRNDLVVSGSTGNVGIGTNQVLSKLNAYASGSNLSVFRVDGGNGTLFEVTDQLSGSLFSVNDVSGLPLLEVFSNNRVVAGKYGTNALVVSGSSVGIGTATPAYKLQVNGSFAATTKSFVIKHPDPAKSDKQLVHGVTEGPEHSVFVRGKLENNNIIQLPDYWQHLVDVDTISVTLTPNKYYQQLYVKNVTDKSIEVGTETDKPINCYYYVVGERKDIPKLITEI